MGSTLEQQHPYHIVDPSPWPLTAALSLFTMMSGAVAYMHSYMGGGYILAFGVSMVLFTMYVWWRDVVREATYQGQHTLKVQMGLRYGMILFILSEVAFFCSFFWAFFHASLAPTVELGSVWPPVGIIALDTWSVPLLNTVILLSSGVAVTWAHHAVISGVRIDALVGLLITVELAILFTILQGLEYNVAPFSINDGIYGTTFFVSTGFHGLHVIVGTIFLTVCFFRLVRHHFTREHHFGLEAAIWYWHFVDVVWLFLFCMIYWWGSA